MYDEYLGSESESSKTNVYILLTNLIAKYNSNESYQKRINISSFQEGVEDMMMDDEDVLEFQD